MRKRVDITLQIGQGSTTVVISGPQAIQELNTVMGTSAAEDARPVEQNIIFRGRHERLPQFRRG